MSTEEKKYSGYIGVFDSGVGGISVLRALVRELPEENFYFFGDSAHAPYGDKTVGEVQELSMAIADRMAAEGCKAIVIACNTATSAAVKLIRQKYSGTMPVIGIEPALKPAAMQEHHGRILVMATPVTLKLEKYHKLSGRLAGEAEFIPVSCSGLADRVEQGNLDAADVTDMLERMIGPYRGKVDGIVLGCTHYPFLKKQIRKVMGDVPLYDGSEGTARELHRQLARYGILRQSEEPGEVILDSSIHTEQEKKLYDQLFCL
ncbi:MAG: glutamate racemase [Bilifractor sp.]